MKEAVLKVTLRQPPFFEKIIGEQRLVELCDGSIKSIRLQTWVSSQNALSRSLRWKGFKL